MLHLGGSELLEERRCGGSGNGNGNGNGSVVMFRLQESRAWMLNGSSRSLLGHNTLPLRARQVTQGLPAHINTGSTLNSITTMSKRCEDLGQAR